jgi:hypothetical protein
VASPTLAAGADPANLLPEEIAGHTMTIQVGQPDSFLGLWNDEAIAQDLLDDLGKTIDDVAIAWSYAEDTTFPETIQINAYQVKGADGEALLRGITDNYLAAIPDWAATEATVAGKDVVVLGPANAANTFPQYFYRVGDIVFNINGNPPEWVEEALTKLP